MGVEQIAIRGATKIRLAIISGYRDNYAVVRMREHSDTFNFTMPSGCWPMDLTRTYPAKSRLSFCVFFAHVIARLTKRVMDRKQTLLRERRAS